MSDRRELLRTVEEQQQQLNRYQKKLRDVVAAYKSIVKEKDALEASLKVLNEDSSTTDTCSSDGRRDIEKQAESSASDHEEIREKEEAEDKQHGSPLGEKVDHQLRDKVSTLTRALATLTEERCRTEANHQADKKKLRQERDELEEALKRERNDVGRLRQTLDEKTTEFRNKLRSHQVDREKEENNHAIMMRELQTLVAIERSEKEKFENQCDDLQRHLSDRRNATAVADECEAYRRQIGDLSDELRSVRNRLRAAEDQASRPQPLLLELQSEMAEMKSQNREAVLQERRRANEAEERLRDMARLSEERVAGLEAKLSELSETVGLYDRTRQQDKQAIQRLKERVTQLDIENTALLSAAPGHSTLDDVIDNDDDLNLGVQGLLQKMIKLKGLLKVANLRSQNPVDLEDILQRDGLAADTDHEACKEELLTLKEEFERYKFRAQSMLKSNRGGGSKDQRADPSAPKDNELTLKAHIAEMRNKIRNLNHELDENKELSARHVHETEEELSRVKGKCARDLAKQEAEFRVTVSELENQMQKQRQRTLTLLEEKDAELATLRMSFGITKPEVEEDDDDDAIERVEEVDQANAAGMLSFTDRRKDDGRLLHYVQEMSKKDVEVSGLRRSKHELESAVRELQTSMAIQEERHSELRAEIRRLQRNRSRELGANLEYLKNVVLRYMLSSDASSRQHMLNAIATMLEFSPKEVDSVRQMHTSAASWWRTQQSVPATNIPSPLF